MLDIKGKINELSKDNKKIFLNKTVNFKFNQDFRGFKKDQITKTHLINAEIYLKAKLGEILK